MKGEDGEAFTIMAPEARALRFAETVRRAFRNIAAPCGSSDQNIAIDERQATHQEGSWEVRRSPSRASISSHERR